MLTRDFLTILIIKLLQCMIDFNFGSTKTYKRIRGGNYFYNINKATAIRQVPIPKYNPNTIINELIVEYVHIVPQYLST